MAYEINKRGFNVFVLLGKNTRIVDLYKKYNLDVIVAPILRIQSTKNPTRLISYIYYLIRSVFIIISAINKYRIDVIHSNDLLDFSANIAAKLKNKKSIQHVRMNAPGILKIFLRKITLLFDDHILCVSNGLRNLLYNTNDKKAEVLYDWIDLNLVEHNNSYSNLRAELNISSDTKIIGCLSRIEYWKGQHVLIEAASIVLKKYNNCIFLLVGGTVRGKESYFEELKSTITNYNLEKKILLLGERKDISNLYSQFDFSVHCSVEPDPFPGVVLESLANNCPVIGARAGGVPEEISEYHTGLLYQPGNNKELADKIVYLLEHPEILDKMRINSKPDVLGKFNKERLINRLIDYYRITS
jgi:glycosyltransferase involved in cell wall biosynthesis